MNDEFKKIVKKIPSAHFQSVLNRKYKNDIESARIALLVYRLIGSRMDDFERVIDNINDHLRQLTKSVGRIESALDIKEDGTSRLDSIEQILEERLPPPKK